MESWTPLNRVKVPTEMRTKVPGQIGAIPSYRIRAADFLPLVFISGSVLTALKLGPHRRAVKQPRLVKKPREIWEMRSIIPAPVLFLFWRIQAFPCLEDLLLRLVGISIVIRAATRPRVHFCGLAG